MGVCPVFLLLIGLMMDRTGCTVGQNGGTPKSKYCIYCRSTKPKSDSSWNTLYPSVLPLSYLKAVPSPGPEVLAVAAAHVEHDGGGGEGVEEGGDPGPRRVPRLAEVARDALVDVVHVQAL